MSHYINGLGLLRPNTPLEERGALIYPALQAVREIIADERMGKYLPRTKEAMVWLQPYVEKLASGQATTADVQQVPSLIMSATITINEELDRVCAYQLSDKGNLSIHHLVNGASKGYDPNVLKYLNDAVISEIDEAGLCLACSLCTACGFHILRSVEMAVKAYVFAATGTFPKQRNRSWGTYIQMLTGIASQKVIDTLTILKGKRNPLMHPQHTLTEPQAISMFCICQSAMESVIEDVLLKTMDVKFQAAFGEIEKLEAVP